MFHPIFPKVRGGEEEEAARTITRTRTRMSKSLVLKGIDIDEELDISKLRDLVS